MVNEYEMKKHLEEIVDHADFSVKNVLNVHRFKWFKIEFVNKDLRSKSGDYNMKTHTIRVFNIKGMDNTFRLLVMLHELSHHIDWCIRGRTDHQAPFYDVYRNLIYSALDLNKFTVQDVMKLPKRTNDYSKVQKIVREYSQNINDNPQTVLSTIYVFNAFYFRQFLKDRKYRWLNNLKAWSKQMKSDEIAGEWEYLVNDLMISRDNIKVIESNTMILTKQQCPKRT